MDLWVVRANAAHRCLPFFELGGKSSRDLLAAIRSNSQTVCSVVGLGSLHVAGLAALVSHGGEVGEVGVISAKTRQPSIERPPLSHFASAFVMYRQGGSHRCQTLHRSPVFELKSQVG